MFKNRKSIFIIVLVAMFVCCFVFSACDIFNQPTHQHKYNQDQWKNDEESHWQTCTECQKDSEKKPHDIEWTTDIPATETAEGLRSGVCVVCGKTFNEKIPVISHQHTVPDNWQFDENGHWKICSACSERIGEDAHSKKWIVDIPATSTSAGSKHSECVTCHKNFGSETIPPLTSAERTVDIYGINDFHGETERIAQVGGYLKGNVNSNSNTVLINSGDMFQGSMESNSNYGNLLSRCMSQIGFDAFTYGNHEFDWGLENLETLVSESAVPFLGANIYHWDAAKKEWGTFADEIAQKYVVKTLDNGLKVGIIGVIGEDQITSISSNLVQTIGFKSPLPIIKELATELREQQGCDVVIVSAHVGPQGLVGERENNECPSSAGGLENYVDAVFCAHTHRQQNYIVDGIPFIQGGSYGSYVSHVKLSVNAQGNVSCNINENVRFSNSWDNLFVVDEMVNNSNEAIKEERNQIVATLNYSLDAYQLPRLVCRAMAEYARTQGYDVSLAMTNNARNALDYGSVTYSDLYQAIPFDNVVYVAKVKGKDIINEARYSSNFIWREQSEAFKENEYYFIAVIDYLLFHQNSNRDYNYFPSAFTSDFTPVSLKNVKYDVYNYRYITRDWLLANSSVDCAAYVLDNTNTDTSKLQQKVTLDYTPVDVAKSQSESNDSSKVLLTLYYDNSSINKNKFDKSRKVEW